MAKTYIDENGYRRFSDSGLLVSRWVGKKKIGRNLDEEEVVHHINRDKKDNRPRNLWVCRDQEEHESFHEEDGDDHWNDDEDDWD